MDLQADRAVIGQTSRVRTLEPHDCVVSKLVANRDKDRSFARALLAAGIVDPDRLVERVNLLPNTVEEPRRRAMVEWVRRTSIDAAPY
jgi:hypothetical protein